MCRFAVLSFALAACFVIATAGKLPENCPGCPSQADPNDPEILSKLTNCLATANSDDSIKKITSAQKQVVSGVKYIVEYITESGKTCNASWVEQAWISKEPQDFTYKCNN